MRKKKFKKKEAGQPCPGIDLRLAGNRWSPAGPGLLTQGRRSLVAGLPATSGQRLVARGRLGPDCSSLEARRPTADWRPAVTHRPQVDTWTVSLCSFFYKKYYLKNNFFG
jgi:hypothetical protein